MIVATILENDSYILESEEKPIVGRKYSFIDAEDATLKQNAAFHSLLAEYWRWGGHPSWGGDGYSDFREKVKKYLGCGFDKYFYADVVNGKPRAFQVVQYEDIPEHIREDPNRKEMIFGRLKSWTDYTKKERQRTIDNLLDDIHANGCNTKKMQEIIRGMSDNGLTK